MEHIKVTRLLLQLATYGKQICLSFCGSYRELRTMNKQPLHLV